MTYFHAVILGAIEGITEFLPISSTAHLLISSNLLHFPVTAFTKLFIVAIQLGAILAIVLFYLKSIPSMFRLWKKVFVAFIPAAIIGFAFYVLIKNFFFESFLIIACGLIAGGIIMILVEKKMKRKNIPDPLPLETLRTLTLRDSFLIGLAQALAVIPGVSRSAATIVSGRLLGYSRESVTLFSFILGTVTLCAAVSYDLLKTKVPLSPDTLPLLVVGFVSALLLAYFSIGAMMRLVSKYGFEPFGWYRIALGIAIVLFLL